MSQLGQEQGFTVLEVVFATSLMVIASLVVTELFTASSSGMSAINAQAVLQSELTVAARYLTFDGLMALRPLSSYQTYTFDSDSQGDGKATLILKVPSINASKDILDIKQHFDHIIYNYDGTTKTLQRIVDAKDGVSSRVDETHVIARGLERVAFDLSSPPKGVTFMFVASRKEGGRQFTQPLTSGVRFRNAFY